MRKAISLLVMLLGLVACSDEAEPEKYNDTSGYWLLETPDNATRVSFRIVRQEDNQYVIDAVTVSHNGTDYNSKPVDAGIFVRAPREIETITLLNTDSTVPFFVIRLVNISVNAEFTEMQIENSTFNIDGVFREFPALPVRRES